MLFWRWSLLRGRMCFLNGFGHAFFEVAIAILRWPVIAQVDDHRHGQVE